MNLAHQGSQGLNQAFDVTPAPLVRSLITEYGSFEASSGGLGKLKEQLDNAS